MGNGDWASFGTDEHAVLVALPDGLDFVEARLVQQRGVDGEPGRYSSRSRHANRGSRSRCSAASDGDDATASHYCSQPWNCSAATDAAADSRSAARTESAIRRIVVAAGGYSRLSQLRGAHLAQDRSARAVDVGERTGRDPVQRRRGQPASTELRPGASLRGSPRHSPGRCPVRARARRRRLHQSEPLRPGEPAARRPLHQRADDLRPAPPPPQGPHPPNRAHQPLPPHPDGTRSAIFYTKLYQRLLGPLLAAQAPPVKPELRAALKVIAHTVDDYISRARINAAA
jgi:hypothetical protein